MTDFKSRYQSKHSLQAGGFTTHEIREITNWVNSNHSRQIPLIRQYYYKEQKVFLREIESSTHMIPMVVQKTSGVQGMSGTLFNRYTYPHKLFQDVEPSKTIYVVSRRILRSNENPDVLTIWMTQCHYCQFYLIVTTVVKLAMLLFYEDSYGVQTNAAMTRP